MLGAKERVDDEDFGSPEAGNGFLWNCLRIGDVSQLSDPIREDRDRTVCEQHGIDTIDAGGDQLQTQLGRRVDEYSRTAVRLHQRADTGALVARIRRATHGASAAKHRDAEAGTGTEEG